MILVTGATGFVGRHLTDKITARGLALRTAVRGASTAGAHSVVVGEIGPDTAWATALQAVEVVVHLAARVHVMRETAPDVLKAFRLVNVGGTERLAREAARAGVRRLVFLSSVKVNGEATHGRPFRESDSPAPSDPYGVSKHEAEAALARVSGATGLEMVVLRPPLVYGPGVGANFLRLMHWVDRGLPLPFGAVRNRRSLVHVGNLVDAVIACTAAPQAAGATFFVDDGEPVSTATLLSELGAVLDRPARLFPVPPALLSGAAALLGRGAEAARLLGDLEVDSSLIRDRTGWRPRVTRADGLSACARWYRASGGASG